MKLEVGMYVRDIKGRIDKIIGFKGALIEFEKDLMGGYIDCNDFTKASYNIIDLIEVGDYVNGFQVYEIDRECCRITLNGGEYGDEFRLTYLRPALGKNMGIKSIVTKEQFKEMEYKVGE